MKTIGDIELAELALEATQDAYLNERGWSRTCSTPGSIYLWAKKYEGKDYLVTTDAAMYLQRSMKDHPRQKESWPFVIMDGNVKIHEDKWYAFSDSGGLCVTLRGVDDAGFDSAEACIVAFLNAGWTKDEFTTNPKDLGGYCATIITGRQYIDRLYELTDLGELTDYGHWSEAGQRAGVV